MFAERARNRIFDFRPFDYDFIACPSECPRRRDNEIRERIAHFLHERKKKEKDVRAEDARFFIQLYSIKGELDVHGTRLVRRGANC